MAKILVVDDSATVRKLIINILKGADYETVEAVDGVDALEKLAQEDIDLIIADLNMPRMNGLELIRTIRKDPVYSDIPIVMLTTEGSEEDKKRGFEAGANVYLVKPAPPSLILYKIGSLLNANKEM